MCCNSRRTVGNIFRQSEVSCSSFNDPRAWPDTLCFREGRSLQIPLPSVGNIAEDSRVLRNGRVIPVILPKKVGAPVIEDTQAKDFGTVEDVGQSSGTNASSDFNEILKLIKKSEYKVVDQLM